MLDPLYSGALAALLTLAGARASRGALLWASVAGVVMARGLLYAPALAALAVAAGHTLARRRLPVVGAVNAAILAQVLLRWPPAVFFGFPAVVAAAVALLVLLSAWRTLGRTGRRVGLAVPATVVILAGVASGGFAVAALRAKPAVDSGTTLARGALSRIGAVGLESASAQIRAASVEMAVASSREATWWGVGAALVPGVAQQRRVVVGLTDSVRDLTATAAQEASTIDLPQLRSSGGTFDLARFEQLARGAGLLDRQLRASQAEVAATRSPWLLAPVRTRVASLDADLAKARRVADESAEGAQALPDILGADGPRHFLVAFMTPAETRGLGGFLGAYAELQTDHGHITIVRSGRPAELVPAPGQPPPRLTGPTDYVDRYGSFEPQNNLEDVTYSPDFPTVERVIGELYPQLAGGDRVDGVLVLDPYALQDLLTFTGPITVDGSPTPLSATNAAEVLLRQQYLDAPADDPAQNARHDLLQQALVVGFQRLTTGALPDPATLSRVLDPDVRAGRLLFWSDRPAIQPFLRQVRLDGAFPSLPAGSEVTAVTVSNYDNNKIDAYLHEAVHDTLGFDPATGHLEEKEQVVLTNNAGATGLPPYVIGTYPGSGIPPGTNRTWLSLYSRLALTGATLDGRPYQLGPPLPEAGARAWSGFVDVPPKSTVILSFTLQGLVARGPQLHFGVRLQPLADPVAMDVRVVLPAGWAQPPLERLGVTEDQDLVWRLARR